MADMFLRSLLMFDGESVPSGEPDEVLLHRDPPRVEMSLSEGQQFLEMLRARDPSFRCPRCGSKTCGGCDE